MVFYPYSEKKKTFVSINETKNLTILCMVLAAMFIILGI